MIRVEFLREAEIEFLEAIVHYEEIAAGLGIDFEREVEVAVAHIESFPTAWPPSKLMVGERLLSLVEIVVTQKSIL